MKIFQCEVGDRVMVPGIYLELEVMAIAPSSVCVRPTERQAVVWLDESGDEVRITTRPKPFTVSRDTIVEVAP